jgi:hypothetical protein
MPGPGLLEALKYFGLAGLIAWLIASIVKDPRLGRFKPYIATVGIVSLVIVFIVDRFSIVVPPPPAGSTYDWVPMGGMADWAGKDRACTTGPQPKKAIGDIALCDEKNVNAVAVCWPNRAGGWPVGVPGDCRNSATWCTYKDLSVNVATPQTGAAPGITHFCAARKSQ